ncbi:hypothetical protein U1Q18_030200 [Sarracenia purpurea var. burkii]
MTTKHALQFSSLQLVFFLFFLLFHGYLSQSPMPSPNTTGYTCAANQSTTYPCQAYAFYRAAAPDYLNLAAIGDLFSVSRLMIATPSNISNPAAALLPNQPLFVPLTCSCNAVNGSAATAISYSNLTYTIKSGDTFYYVSTGHFQNLTTYQSVEIVNPTLVPTQLEIGVNVIFPIFCQCPNTTQKQNQTNFLISYVLQPSDNFTSVASRFGTTAQSIADVNGNNVQTFETIFVPVSKLPQLTQPISSSPSSDRNPDRKGEVIGLAIGLGICGFVLVLVIGFWGYREANLLKKKKRLVRDEEEERLGRVGKRLLKKETNLDLVADVSDCLDKYKVYEIEELREATDGFDEKWLIQGSVYKGCINGGFHAIKKMKWNACEELKILQKGPCASDS